ncbi:hypothetical protein UO65_1936 [Actinokineospora spheciospongiae]|uniref:Uncharacterized protein n=1 Tax=Actinokineospora spheciospongiae TaxID=909613 RepID=W7J137_9PSEU|nr:hypothetical protein UO65_1936 [Actinokineospora spheciospongiae]
MQHGRGLGHECACPLRRWVWSSGSDAGIPLPGRCHRWGYSAAKTTHWHRQSPRR